MSYREHQRLNDIHAAIGAAVAYRCLEMWR